MIYLLWGPGTSYGTYNPADLPSYDPTSKSMETLHDRSIPKKTQVGSYRVQRVMQEVEYRSWELKGLP